ncbi:MAG: cytochrome b [Gammaproteobacteria bacterium]|nr:MAG: cytochrome b [Gammaproteobacteria bacterium]
MTTTRYHTAVITVHWLMLLLIAAAYACIELREIYPKGSDPREAMKTWHFMIGLSVLALTGIRIGLRMITTTPPIVPAQAPAQQWVAKAMALALYGWMISLPLIGWLVLSAAGKPIPFFGLSLPALIAENKDLAGQLKEVHELLGQTGYALIALHAAASLFHHYKLRDNTLLRMLPGR